MRHRWFDVGQYPRPVLSAIDEHIRLTVYLLYIHAAVHVSIWMEFQIEYKEGFCWILVLPQCNDGYDLLLGISLPGFQAWQRGFPTECLQPRHVLAESFKLYKCKRGRTFWAAAVYAWDSVPWWCYDGKRMSVVQQRHSRGGNMHWGCNCSADIGLHGRVAHAEVILLRHNALTIQIAQGFNTLRLICGQQCVGL